MPSLLDFGAIAQLKDMAGVPRRGPLDPLNLFKPLDVDPPRGLLNTPIGDSQGVSGPTAQQAAGQQAMQQGRGFMDRNVLAPELQGLLSPEDQAAVKPGLLTSIGNFVFGGETPRQRQVNRAKEMLATRAEVGAPARQREMEEARKAAVASIDWSREDAPQLYAAALMRAGADPKEMAQAFKDFAPAEPRRIDPLSDIGISQAARRAAAVDAATPRVARQERPYLGGRAIFVDGVFDKWIVEPGEKDGTAAARRELALKESVADKFIEATDGDVGKAGVLLNQSPSDLESVTKLGFTRSDLEAAAQRYKIRKAGRLFFGLGGGDPYTALGGAVPPPTTP